LRHIRSNKPTDAGTVNEEHVGELPLMDFLVLQIPQQDEQVELSVTQSIEAKKSYASFAILCDVKKVRKDHCLFLGGEVTS